MDPKPPPPSSSHTSYTSFPILALSILGILATAILLLSYYLFVIKCCLNWRRPNLLLFPLPSRRFRRPRSSPHPQPPEYRGLASSVINSIPTFRFAKHSSSSECAVCLAEFRDKDLLRLLPHCSHSFHIDCIDVWLQFNPNCPLCRNDITSSLPLHQQLIHPPQQHHPTTSGDVVTGNEDPNITTAATSTSDHRPRRFWQTASRGDECIDVRGKDERFVVQPIRRSFSMDSSGDRQLYVSVQEILRRNPNLFRDVARNGEGSSSGAGAGNASGRIRRSFFSFGRSSRSAAASILPLQGDQLL